jgi:pSer/pThr/pTyr-binding forkhead associated (FHA) protein
MSDKRTRKLETTARDTSFLDFRERHIASLVVVSGGAEGSEYILDEPKLRIGRGPDVEFEFEDSAMSREHVLFEFADGGFVARDLGSTNGTRVNGEAMAARELGHGDRIEIGGHVFQFLVEDRTQAPPTYLLPDA